MILLLLAALMLLTRIDHIGSALSLPDASLAVFFFAGLALAERRWLLLLLGVAALIDYVAIKRAGSSDACFTAAYPFLVPACACRWVAGRRTTQYAVPYVGYGTMYIALGLGVRAALRRPLFAASELPRG